MRGLLTKILQEAWLPTLAIGIALCLATMLLTFILPQIHQALGAAFQQIPFMRFLLSGLMGNQLGDVVTPRTMQAFVWVHPVPLALVWAHEIILCSRMPAAEIDRGTIDVLLSLPVARRTVYACETIVWLASGLIVVLMGLTGHLIAAPNIPQELRPDLATALLVLVNLYGLYVAVGGIAFLASSLSNRRGRAVGVVFALLLASFLLNFIANFWQPARQVAFLGLLHYYNPAQILQNGTFPARDIMVLVIVGTLTWLAGGAIFSRRSIITV
jgi:ABC-type transport system involved in multi-copper enzyme maturation permease subunit